MKKIPSLAFAAALFVAAALLTPITSCTKEVGKIPPPAPVPVGFCDTITFAKHIDPLIQTKCIACHGSQPSGNSVQLTSYGQVKAVSDDGRLYGVIIEGPSGGHQWMPLGAPNGLPEEEKNLFNCWISQGERP